MTEKPPSGKKDYLQQLLSGHVPPVIVSAMHVASQNNLTPTYITDDTFRALIGTASGAAIAPILEKLRPYIEGTKPIPPDFIAKSVEKRADYLHMYGFSAETPIYSDPIDDIRQSLRLLAAGIQQAYETQPWLADLRLDFDFDTKFQNRGKAPAYVLVNDKTVGLAVLPEMAAGYAVRKACHIGHREVVKDCEFILNADERTLWAGMEEGRHIAQNTIPELYESLKQREIDQSNYIDVSADIATGEQGEYTRNPFEMEAKHFTASHMHRIRALGGTLTNAAPLPVYMQRANPRSISGL